MIIIDGIIYSLQGSGGISVYFDELIKEINKGSESSRLMVYPNNNHYTKGFSVSEKPRVNISIERYLDVITKEKHTKNDIFHSSYYRLPSQKEDFKVITTVHDFTYEVFPKGLKTKLHHWQKRRAILNSDGIICISESTKRDLLNFIPEANSIPIRVIHNGVGDFRPIENTVLEKKNVLFVGARDGYKNFHTCIGALENHKDLHLVVVGGGRFNESELAILNKTLPGRFRHAGFITEEELNEYYSSAFCLVYPSLYEGFGIPVIEAMKSGCPVIASNTSSIKEIATDASILLNDINSKNVNEALNSLHNSSLRRDLVVKGLDRATLYSWSKMGAETIDFYNEIRDCK